MRLVLAFALGLQLLSLEPVFGLLLRMLRFVRFVRAALHCRVVCPARLSCMADLCSSLPPAWPFVLVCVQLTAPSRWPWWASWR